MKAFERRCKLVDQWTKGGADVVRVELTEFHYHDVISVVFIQSTTTRP
jgi:hypothetical protein